MKMTMTLRDSLSYVQIYKITPELNEFWWIIQFHCKMSGRQVSYLKNNSILIKTYSPLSIIFNSSAINIIWRIDWESAHMITTAERYYHKCIKIRDNNLSSPFRNFINSIHKFSNLIVTVGLYIISLSMSGILSYLRNISHGGKILCKIWSH